MKRKKGYQLFDVPNTSRGHRFVQDINDFINRDWYGYQRRGRLPKPGVKTNSQRQARVLDSSSWTIYIRGLPTPRKFIQHSEVQRAIRDSKYYLELYNKTVGSIYDKDDAIKSLKQHLNLFSKKLNEKRFKLFGWNISLWKVLDSDFTPQMHKKPNNITDWE